jgi:putative copper export protein
VLAIAAVAELSAYATLASGEPLSLGLLRETLLETRVGNVWLARLGLALLTAALVTAAARSGRRVYWWSATGTAALLLMTLGPPMSVCLAGVRYDDAAAILRSISRTSVSRFLLRSS